jgi:hypothetical protein
MKIIHDGMKNTKVLSQVIKDNFSLFYFVSKNISDRMCFAALNFALLSPHELRLDVM